MTHYLVTYVRRSTGSKLTVLLEPCSYEYLYDWKLLSDWRLFAWSVVLEPELQAAQALLADIGRI